MDNNESKKIAIVTGGAKGIGKEIVKSLSQKNYYVILDYRNTIPSYLDFNNNVEFFQSDVSNSDNCKKIISYVIGKFGRIDLLINNAGIDIEKPITDFSDDEFDSIMKNNLYSAFFLSREVSREMVKRKSGHIINISSIWGITGSSCEVPYSISKAGMDGLTKSLAKELGPSNIRVNSIAPGYIDTDMNNYLNDDEVDSIKSEIPLGRTGKPIDITKAVIFLEENPYITGQIIQVNGGWNI